MRSQFNDSTVTNYAHVVECVPVAGGLIKVTFYTQWKDAKDPTALHKKHQLFLTEKDLTTLTNFLTTAINNKD